MKGSILHKRKLLDDCDLWVIVSMPGGGFTVASAGMKTNLLFFTKSKSTEKIWCYDLSDIKVCKKTPITMDHFNEFFKLLPQCPDSERSWTITVRRSKHAAMISKRSIPIPSPIKA